MKILVVSDKVVDWIYSPKIRLALPDIDLVICCGDLPLYYLDFIVSSLDVPLLHVFGNHSIPADEEKLSIFNPHWAINIHCEALTYQGHTFAGVEGSVRYNEGAFQYTQFDMWLNVIKLVPSLLANRLKYGKYLNVFITHAPPWGIHDQSDLAHQGIKAFRWLIANFHPDYHFHGHIHVYRPDTETVTQFGRTQVVNTYGYRRAELL